jgi:hypothetical protein
MINSEKNEHIDIYQDVMRHLIIIPRGRQTKTLIPVRYEGFF